MKAKSKLLPVITLSFIGLMLCACTFENKDEIKSTKLFPRKIGNFCGIFYEGDLINYDGLKVYDENNNEITDYTLSIPEGTVLSGESEKVKVEVSKGGYENGSFNIFVLPKDEAYTTRVDIYAINDFHGSFEYKEGEQTGLSRIVEYLLKKKEENPFTIILSTGDMWQGGVESNKTKGKIVNEAMNIATFDAMTLGNHEFDWGEEVIKENCMDADFPYLAANLTYSSNNQMPSYLDKSVIISRGDLKVGVIGTLASDLGYDITASVSKNFKFNYPNDYIKEEAKSLRDKGCDLVILASHDSGFYDYSTNEDYKFGDVSAPGEIVDGVFLGHDHYRKSGEYNGVPYVEGGKNGNYLSHLSYSFTLNNNEVTLGYSIGYETISTFNMDFNESNEIVDSLTTKYKEVIGDVNRVICNFNEYKSKEDLLDIACNAIISYINSHKDLYGVEVSVAVHNYGGVRDSVDKGEFTYSDLIRVFPFSNTLVLFNPNEAQYYDVINYNHYVKVKDPTFINGTTTIGTINYVAESYGNNFVDTGVFIQDVIEEYLVKIINLK